MLQKVREIIQSLNEFTFVIPCPSCEQNIIHYCECIPGQLTKEQFTLKVLIHGSCGRRVI